MRIRARIVHCPNKSACLQERVMRSRVGITVVASEAVVDQIYAVNVWANPKHKILRFHVIVYYKTGV